MSGSTGMHRAEGVSGRAYSKKRRSRAGMALARGGPRRAVTPRRLEQHRMWNHWPGSAVHHAVRCFPGDIICEQCSPDPRWRSRQKDHWNTGITSPPGKAKTQKSACREHTCARTHTHTLLSLPLALPIPCYPPMRPPPPLPPKLSPPPPNPPPPHHQLGNVFRTREPRRQAASSPQPLVSLLTRLAAPPARPQPDAFTCRDWLPKARFLPSLPAAAPSLALRRCPCCSGHEVS